MPVEAATWHLSPFVQASETYTDNITLQPTGQKESEYVTQINPGLSLTGEGRRLDLSLYYRLQNLFYAKVNSRNNSNQQLLANVNAELVRRMFFFQGRTSYRQMVINPEGNIGQGRIAINGSRGNIATSSLSPYFKRRLGSWSQAELRYSRSTIRYLNGQLNNSSVTNAISGQLADAKLSDRWTWKMAFSSTKVEYAAGLRPGRTWQNINFALDYRLSRKFNANATVGYQDNKYQQRVGAAAPGGSFWNLGMSWRPTPRTNVVFGRGERYFGSVWNLDLTHRGRRSLVQATYVQGLSTRRQSLLNVPQFDPAGNPVINPNTSGQISGRIPVYGVFLRRRAQLKMEYRTQKSTTSVRVYKLLREYQNSDRKTDTNGGFVSWRLNLSRRTSLTLNTRVVFMNVTGNSSYTNDLLTSRVSLQKRLGRQLTASLNARNIKRIRSNLTGYTENQLTARLTYHR